MSGINISDFIDTEVRDFSKYVLYSRAIPSLIDGLKPSQRKILWTAIKSASTKNIKTASLSGNVISMANYHHGDASLNDAINSMAQTFKNNNTLIEGEGSFGSRAIPVAAAARYTFVKLAKTFDKYFADTNIAPESIDPEDPEPQYYLPLIPWVLVNGIRGIAVGFATEIQPRSIKDLKKACTDYISGKNIDGRKIKPHYPHFVGSFELNEKGVWDCFGAFELKGKKLTITEIPIGYDREQYIKVLDGLVDDKEIVRYKETKSTTKGFRFEVTLRNGKNLTDKNIITKFKLKKAMNENITVIDENGNLKIFQNEIDVIKHFCDFRIQQYPERYRRKIKYANAKVTFKSEKIRFIDEVNSGRIQMKASTRIVKKALLHIQFTPDTVDKLVIMPINHLSVEKVAELKGEIKDLKADINKWKQIDFEAQYKSEIKAI